MIELIDGDLSQFWYEQALQSSSVGCDIETSGLTIYPTADKPIADRIATFQLYVPNTGIVMIRNLANFPSHLIRLLEHPGVRKIFHHAPFDIGFLMRDYPYLQPRRLADTKVAAKIFDPNKTVYTSHSLKHLVKFHFNWSMDKTIAVSDWFAETLDPKQLEYAAKDVEYLVPLLEILERQLKDIGMLNYAMSAYDYIPSQVMIEAKTGITNIFAY